MSSDEVQLLDEEDIVHNDFPSVIHIVKKTQAPAGEVFDTVDVFIQGQDLEECKYYYDEVMKDDRASD